MIKIGTALFEACEELEKNRGIPGHLPGAQECSRPGNGHVYGGRNSEDRHRLFQKDRQFRRAASLCPACPGSVPQTERARSFRQGSHCDRAGKREGARIF